VLVGLAVAVLSASGLLRLAMPPFTAHMVEHMLLVTVAGAGLSAGASRAVDLLPGGLRSPLVASMVEGVAVWAWHAPALHEAARESAVVGLVEHATFLATGTWLWSAALRTAAEDGGRDLEAITSLLLTSMHMTLLGALVALSGRALYAHHGGAPGALLDQQVGGAVMILMGLLAYGAGALVLANRWLGPARTVS